MKLYLLLINFLTLCFIFFRTYLWSDLAKIARKQGLWDIARVSCIFCFLYDDKNLNKNSDVSDEEKGQAPVDVKTITKDLKRLSAEVHFIYAEVSFKFF